MDRHGSIQRNITFTYGGSMNCPACESADIEHSSGQLALFIALRTGLSVDAAHSCTCRQCGLHFSSHRLTESEAAAIYRDYRTETYTQQREQCEPGYAAQYGNLNQTRPYMREVEEFISPTRPTKRLRILDYGGNDGGNTPFPESHIDIYEVGDPWPTQQYDLIVCAHVLEHVNFPRQTIDSLRTLLEPGGLIYIEVPIEPSVNIWHEHINQFTVKALQETVRNNHLATQDMGTELGLVRMMLTR